MNNTPIETVKSSRLVISMVVAGLLSGLIIIGIYLATYNTIKENKARELKEAVFKVLPGVTQMLKLQFDKNTGNFSEINSDEINQEMIFVGLNKQQQLLGFALQGEGPGFQDTIRLLYGFNPFKDEIVGMEILESRETPGLGDKIYKDNDFVANFAHLFMTGQIDLVKKGKKQRSSEVEAITGATISSKAVVKIINRSFAYWQEKLPKADFINSLNHSINHQLQDTHNAK